MLGPGAMLVGSGMLSSWAISSERVDVGAKGNLGSQAGVELC